MLKGVDIAVIETGMGGRLDATNVVTPTVSVLTSISMEHQRYLGDTIAKIAKEKAGIIKRGAEVISGVNDERAREVIEAAADAMDAKVYQLHRDFTYTKIGADTFDYTGINRSYSGIKKSLMGGHQFDNFSLAIAATELIEGSGFLVGEWSIRSGLGDVKWAGRFDLFSDDPLLILDGAHNDASMRTAIDTLKANFAGKRIISVIGVMSDKDTAGILKRVCGVSDTVILTKPAINRAADPNKLLTGFESDANVISVPDVKSALDRAYDLYEDGSIIFVSGSLFTVGDALKYLKKGD